MGRFLTLLMLMILGAMAQPSPYFTRGDANGLNWMSQSEQVRIYYVNGTMDAYANAYFEVISELKGDCYSTLPTNPTWFRNVKPYTVGDLVKGVDAFYEDGANISLPIIKALHYVHMKLAGATRGELDQFKAGAFKDIAPLVPAQRPLNPKWPTKGDSIGESPSIPVNIPPRIPPNINNSHLPSNYHLANFSRILSTMNIRSLEIRSVSADEVPSWVLRPLPAHVQEAIDILEDALSELQPYLEQPFRLRYWRAWHRISDAISHLQAYREQPTDEEWLREMGIGP